MDNKKDRDRDNASGEFVSDAEADRRPESTTSEEVKTDPLKQIFRRLKKGGKIVYGAEGETFKAFGDTFSYVFPMGDE